MNFLLWSLNAKYRVSSKFQEDRARVGTGEPDRICLSYTHDADYTRYIDAPTIADAEKRGVMLHQVRVHFCDEDLSAIDWTDWNC